MEPTLTEYKQLFTRSTLRKTPFQSRLLVFASSVLIINLIMGLATHFIFLKHLHYGIIWVSAHGLFGICLLAANQWLLQPLKRIRTLLHDVFSTMAQEVPRAQPGHVANIRHMASDIARFTTLARDYYVKYQQTNRALLEARQNIAAMSSQQQTILQHTNRELLRQYQSVLAYANYLEEHIERHSSDAILRYDFDDVCESSFALKLLAGAFDMLSRGANLTLTHVPVANVMQTTMLALAASLDRRSMKLSSAEVDIAAIAYTDKTTLSHVLWMMLLGTIRYAADESTLTLGCHYTADKKHIVLSVRVSGLAPGNLSPDERMAHLARQLEENSPHLFAETIKTHANLQVAEMLLTRVDAVIRVVPIAQHACEIQLTLPTGK